MSDLRFAFRTLAQRPGFSLAVVLTLALGIGATTVVFDLLNLFHWRELPAARPGELVEVYTESPHGFYGPYGPTAWLDYVDYRDGTRSLAGLAAYEQWNLNLESDRLTEEVEVRTVTGNYFEVLGLRPALGRLLDAGDDAPGGPPAAVLSHDRWLDLGADPGIVGESLRLAGTTLYVVGVAPEGFRGLYAGARPAVFVPGRLGREVFRDPDPPGDRSRPSWSLIGRLAPGFERGQAAAELAALAERMDREHPVPGTGRRVTVVRATLGHPVDQLRMRATLRVFGAAVALLLLIVCANVANLLLARAAARRREMGIRQSLGAGRKRLVRQLLTESLLLALAGGLGGLLLALLARSLAEVYLGPEIVAEMRFDHRVVGLTTLVSLAVPLIFGLAPALVTSRVDLVAALKVGVTTTAGGRRRVAAGPALAVAQVALSLVLLVASGLLVANLWQFQRADLGFPTDNLLMARVDLSSARDRHPSPAAFFRQLRERAAAIPGVRSAGVTFFVPPVFLDVQTEFRLSEDPETVHSSRFEYADAGAFETLGLPLLRGRLFQPQDAESGHGVVVVNRLLAETLWPGEPAIGRVVRFERLRPGDVGPDYEVVGVVGDASQFVWSRAPEPTIYLTWEQRPRPNLSLLMRTGGGDPAAVFAALRDELRRLDPGLALTRTLTHDAHRWDALVEQRLQTQTLALFGAAGLALALLGIFGVMTYAVSRQTREIGIRMAVGARPGDLLRWVLRRGLAMASAGIVLGLVGSLWALRLLQRWMSGLTGMDPAVLAATVAVLLVASLLAVLLPARRAARVDPLTALRHE